MYNAARVSKRIYQVPNENLSYSLPIKDRNSKQLKAKMNRSIVMAQNLAGI